MFSRWAQPPSTHMNTPSNPAMVDSKAKKPLAAQMRNASDPTETFFHTDIIRIMAPSAIAPAVGFTANAIPIDMAIPFPPRKS